jgi:hypothetical protein
LATGSALTFDGTNLGVGGAAIIGLPIEITATTAGVAFKTGASNYTFGAIYTTTSLMTLQSGQSGTGSNVPIAFSVFGSEQMRLNSTGLGIGTSSPAYKLDVVGALNLQGSSTFPTTGMFLRSADNQLKIIGGSAGIAFAAASGASTYATIDSAGILGLGVTPSAWASGYKALQVSNSSIYGTGDDLNFASNTYISSGGTPRYIDAYSFPSKYEMYNGTHKWYNSASTQGADNAITFTQAMTLDASGNLLVGTTISSQLLLGGFNVVYNSGSSYQCVGHVSGTGSGTSYQIFSYNGTVIGQISQNGTTGVLYNLTSDYRLKNNQEDLTGAKDFIMALKPKKWQWWDGSGEGVGFIAHEFMEIAKYSGHGEKDAVDADGKPVYQSIQPSSSEVMANLVSLIQEQQALIESLTTRLTTLENKA